MEQTDATLIEQSRNGSLDAFDELMIRYQRLVTQIARNFCGDADAALDIGQNVFLKAYQKLDAIKEPARFKHWLIRITYNECVTWSRSRRKFDLLDDQALPTDERADQGVAHREVREKLAELLSTLNPKHRLALVLKYFEGLPIREIAHILETSEDVVKNMLYRSMRRLAQQAGS